MVEQNTLQWHRDRLGKFSASSIYKLIGKTRWTQTALSYMMERAYERDLDPTMVSDDDSFAEFLDERNPTSKAMRWGHLMEPGAKMNYEMVTGLKVTDCESIDHPTIENMSASPDGMVGEDGLIEVKCPFGMEMFMRYAMLVHNGEDLKKVKPEYYWQIQAQLSVTGRKWCDFVVFDPYLKTQIIVRRINRNDADIALLEETVKDANNYINDNLSNLVKYEI